MECSPDRTQLRQLVETSASKANNMVGKRQLLVDDDAEASNRAEQMNV